MQCNKSNAALVIAISLFRFQYASITIHSTSLRVALLYKMFALLSTVCSDCKQLKTFALAENPFLHETDKCRQ